LKRKKKRERENILWTYVVVFILLDSDIGLSETIVKPSLWSKPCECYCNSPTWEII